MFGRMEAVRVGGLVESVVADDGVAVGMLLAPMAPVIPPPLLTLALVLVPLNILGRMDADRVDDGVVAHDGIASDLTAAGAILVASAA